MGERAVGTAHEGHSPCSCEAQGSALAFRKICSSKAPSSGTITGTTVRKTHSVEVAVGGVGLLGVLPERYRTVRDGVGAAFVDGTSTSG